MATKTETAFDYMDYLVTAKETNPHQQTDAFAIVLESLSDIRVSQIQRGLCSEEDIEKFGDFLPTTTEMFTNKEMHPDRVAHAHQKYQESVKIALLTSSMEDKDLSNGKSL